MNKQEIKPCPFCGGKAETEYMRRKDEYWSVLCIDEKCLINPYEYGFTAEEEAIAAWNTRG